MPYEEKQPEYPAFKMKAGSEGPFRKNFPSAFEQREMGIADSTAGVHDRPMVTNPDAHPSMFMQRGLVHEGIPGGFGQGGDIDPHTGGSVGDLPLTKGPREKGPGQTETTWV
tara:strand:- start:95 stop:430 length:336 start_codon:yes stop_codon:yes gene_type:complete